MSKDNNTQKLATDYFCKIEPDMLDYLEDLAYNSLKERKESHARLREDSRKTLTLLLSGMGLFFGFTVNLLVGEHVNIVAVIALTLSCAWLCFCSLYLLENCIQTIQQPPVHPDPDIFYDQWAKDNSISLNKNRKRNLPALQGDIEDMIAINEKLAKHLNRARFLAALTPVLLIVFIASLAF